VNTFKTFFFLLVLSSLLLLAGGLLGGSGGIILALVLALAMNFFAYWFSDRIALAMSHAQRISETDDPALYRLVAEQAQRAGLPMPKVYLMNTETPNAFATGRNPSHATVAVTSGIRRLLTNEELGAVLAHEMAHVGNRDTLIMTVVATIAGAISMLATMAQWGAMFGGMGNDRDREGGGNWIALIIVAVVMPIAAMLVRLAISRSREYQADATGARTSGNPYALASALEKLEKGNRARPMHVSEGVSHLFIVNPLSGKAMANLFATHPPIPERARRLRAMVDRPNFARTERPNY
jgi:heat shock protein HtpX